MYEGRDPAPNWYMILQKPRLGEIYIDPKTKTYWQRTKPNSTSWKGTIAILNQDTLLRHIQSIDALLTSTNYMDSINNVYNRMEEIYFIKMAEDVMPNQTQNNLPQYKLAIKATERFAIWFPIYQDIIANARAAVDTTKGNGTCSSSMTYGVKRTICNVNGVISEKYEDKDGNSVPKPIDQSAKPRPAKRTITQAAYDWEIGKCRLKSLGTFGQSSAWSQCEDIVNAEFEVENNPADKDAPPAKKRNLTQAQYDLEIAGCRVNPANWGVGGISNCIRKLNQEVLVNGTEPGVYIGSDEVQYKGCGYNESKESCDAKMAERDAKIKEKEKECSVTNPAACLPDNPFKGYGTAILIGFVAIVAVSGIGASAALVHEVRQQ